MKAPLVSVVVPTRNRPALLGQTLGSIAGQEQLSGVAVEVVVVNDGGSDVTAVVEAAAATGLRIRSVTLPARQGLPSARNAGMEAARGRYLAFLDDDDVFLPRHLRTALDALDGGGLDAVYTTCLVSAVRVDPTAAAPAPPTVVANGYRFDRELLSVANFIPVHSAVLRRPSSADARFDPELTALEDWDFWQRLVHDHRYRFAYVAEPTVVYHRITAQEGMCSAAASDAAALAGFGMLAEHLWRRWPAANLKTARFRAYVGVLYWQVFTRLCLGRPVADMYWQYFLRVMVDAWAGAESEHDLIERIHHAVEGPSRAA